MKVRVQIEVDVDVAAWQVYLAEYPGFGDESIAETLTREAIAAWEFEGLTSPAPGAAVVPQAQGVES